MPHLLRVSLKQPPSEDAPYPYSLPVIRTLTSLDVNVEVTFFVGENGSGKSTLLEGIAAAAELPALGSADVAVDDTLVSARQLAGGLRLAWSQRSRQGFFLRAEDFFGYQKTQARIDARIARERSEAPVRGDEPTVVGGAPIHPDEQQAARFIARYDSRSHGEGFMDVLKRVRPGGLYVLDEPEAPLSPRGQIALLNIVARAAKAGAQFIIATHSPILLACPRARIYSFDQVPIVEVEYDALAHVRVARDFLKDPKRFVVE